MNCIRSIRYLHSSSLSLARQRPLKASLPSHINPESVADDILDSLFLETTRSSQPIKREPLIVEDVESYSSLNEITVTRGRSNRRIRPVKIEPPSISSRLAPLNSPKQPPKEEETIQEEKTWEQDLDAYVPPPTSTEKDMSWFVGHVENFKKTTPEFIPRWKKRADDFEEAITTPSRPEISLEKLEFSPETLRDGLIATLEGERASDIVVLDVTGKTDMARFMIIATGRSKRQIYGLVDACKRFVSPLLLIWLGSQVYQPGRVHAA